MLTYIIGRCVKENQQSFVNGVLFSLPYSTLRKSLPSLPSSQFSSDSVQEQTGPQGKLLCTVGAISVTLLVQRGNILWRQCSNSFLLNFKRGIWSPAFLPRDFHSQLKIFFPVLVILKFWVSQMSSLLISQSQLIIKRVAFFRVSAAPSLYQPVLPSSHLIFGDQPSPAASEMPSLQAY